MPRSRRSAPRQARRRYPASISPRRRREVPSVSACPQHRRGGAACMASRMVPVARHARPILIVDDDHEILAAERQVLADEGFTVREAHDGAEALAAMDEDPPAMIVLDVNMPGIHGPTFARELRFRLKHVPLIILTAPPDPQRAAPWRTS